MSTETDDQSRDEQPQRSRPAMKFAANVYQHVTSIIGAFALIALLGHFVDFDWRGFMATLVAQWNDFVRPAINLVVTIPLGWLGWHVELPVEALDYLAVGLATVMSLIRTAWSNPEVRPQFKMLDWIVWALSGLFFVFWFWPIAICWMLLFLVGGAMTRDRETFVKAAVTLAPLGYMGLLLAVNYLML